MRRGIGPGKIALWAQVEQAPRQSITVPHPAISLHHDKPGRTNRNELPQVQNPPRFAHTVDRSRHEAARRIPEGITNR